MQDRIKEHDRDIRLARTQTSAVSEHANETGHLPIWKEVKEARNSFFGLGVYLLKSKFRIEDKLRFP